MNSAQHAATAEARPIVHGGTTCYRERFAEMPADQRGHYFAHRSNSHFFPVPDADETQRRKIDAILDGRFEFNGEAHELPDPQNWLVNPSADVEWHILWHKFYYAVGLGIAFEETADVRYLRKWVSLAESWIEVTPPGFIAADVTGRRVQNWIYAHIYFAKSIGSEHYPVQVFEKIMHALHVQVDFLCAHLTPARNHRTLELYAIFLAGVAFPELERAHRWREFALRELAVNIQTDLLPDGVQCELSTDYHHLVLKNYLCMRRLAQLNSIAVPEQMDQRLIQALEFSMFAHKPDSAVPSLSDGDSRSFLSLLREGYELFGREDMLYVATQGSQGVPPRHTARGFPASGYYILRSGWGSQRCAYRDEQYLIFDCGPLGAGNHGHLDCLNFELAAFGRSLIVDPGRYTYSEAGEVNWRVHFRGTAAHNTVTVDDRNQTRYEPKMVKDQSRHCIGTVRHRITGPAPNHELRTFFASNGFGLLHGVARSHEYNAVHERQIAFVFQEYWIVSDHLYDSEHHSYTHRLHLSESSQDRVDLQRRWGTIVAQTPNLTIAHEDTCDIDFRIEPGFVSYRYGVKHSAPVIALTQSGATARFNTVLYPHCASAPEIVVRQLTAEKINGDASASACALRIQFTTPSNTYTDHVLLSDSAHAVWKFGKFTFSGKHAALREDTTGELIAVYADRGAWLEKRGQRIEWRGVAT